MAKLKNCSAHFGDGGRGDGHAAGLDRRTFVALSGGAIAGATLFGGVGQAAGASTPLLLVDRMLTRTARWLRAAGYDTEIPSAKAGRNAVLRRAANENRLFITTNPTFVELEGAAGRLILIPESRVARTAAEISARLGVDWLHDPLTRCLPCNGALRVIAADELRIYAPHALPSNHDGAPVTHCARCNQTYWHGDHVDGILARLENWANGKFV